MINKLRRSFLLAMFATLTMVSAVSVQAQTVVLRIAHAMPTTHGYQIWAEKFRDELKKLVGDRVDVKIFPNAQLGKETEYIEGMKLGTIDGAVFGRHGQIDPRLDVLNLPMIYRDDAHVAFEGRGWLRAVHRQLHPVGRRDRTLRDAGVRKRDRGVDARQAWDK